MKFHVDIRWKEINKIFARTVIQEVVGNLIILKKISYFCFSLAIAPLIRL